MGGGIFFWGGKRNVGVRGGGAPKTKNFKRNVSRGRERAGVCQRRRAETPGGNRAVQPRRRSTLNRVAGKATERATRRRCPCANQRRAMPGTKRKGRGSNKNSGGKGVLL